MFESLFGGILEKSFVEIYVFPYLALHGKGKVLFTHVTGQFPVNEGLLSGNSEVNWRLLV